MAVELIEKIKVMDIIREIASVYSKESEKDNSIALQMALNASYNAVVTIEDAINDIDCVDIMSMVDIRCKTIEDKNGVKWIMRSVNNLPHNVSPVIHGKWIYGEDVDIQCSVCGMDAMTNGDYRQEKSNFCPNCGAKMCLEDD